MNPPAEVVKEVAAALADSDQAARRDPRIKRILAGKGDYAMVLPALRSHVARVLGDRDSTGVTYKNRAVLALFAVEYGTPRPGVRKAPDGEAMTERLNLRMTPGHRDLMGRAAARAKVPLTDYIRDAALIAARVDLHINGSE